MVIMTEDPDLSFSSQQDSTYHKALHESTRYSIPPRRVSFYEQCICYDVMSLNDYSPEEVKDSWYSVQEYLKMRASMQTQIKQLEAGSIPETKVRGLEHRTKKGMRRKLRARESAYFAVFSEIDLQNEHEIIDEVSIADAYSVHSKHSAAMAVETAQKDAREALRIYRKAFTKNQTKNQTKKQKKKRRGSNGSSTSA